MTTGEELTHTTDTSRPVTVGSRLCVASHFGTVRFRGPVPAGSDAIWLGVEWDDPTRGKHSGTHGGVSYFQTTVAGSGTFLRESKVGADMLPRSLLAAMQEKYLAAQPTDSVVRLGGAADGVEVETVGWEKIARKVKDGSLLKEVGVADMRVGFRGGEQGELGRRFPAIVDLDLSRSLLVWWSDVAEICAELPQLASLRLAHNRFASVKEDRGAAAQRFLNVKALTLHHTETPWAEMEEIAALFPVLEELHFGFNRLDASPFDPPRDSFAFAHLRLLNLEYNNLTSWSAIKGLGRLPCLTTLMLNGNAIENVEVPASNEFASLTTLSISDNQLSSWAAIHALNSFPTLTTIRLQRNPILANLPPADARSILTARLANATVLNGAEITERFRRDAELFYLSLYAKDAATEDPASFARTHPRHAALVALHGAPAIAPASATSTILKDRVLTLIFVYGEKTVRKKVPINMGIRPLKVLVARVFKIPDATALVLTKMEEGGGDVELDDDLRDVDFYGVESGNKIRVGLYTDIVTLSHRRNAMSGKHMPIVLWHGMGDFANNPDSMGAIKLFLEQDLPGVYVHAIQIGETDDEDRRASFLDRLDRQVDEVCGALAADPNLAGGFNAIGFSQGGQFLRAYVQRCNSPPVHNLITYGAQHAGVSEWPGCKDRSDVNCQLAHTLLLSGAYLPWVQSRVVQAQYYKDAKKYDAYLEKNIFLPDLNNEKVVKNGTYKQNLMSLNALVLLQFENDDMVVPKESSWFGYWDEEGNVIRLEDQPLYKEDWLGLKSMNEGGRLVFDMIPGKHMEIDLAYLREVIIPTYLEDSDANGNEGAIVVQGRGK